MERRNRPIILAIFIAVVFVIAGAVLLLTPRPESYSLQKWLDGEYCTGFCWQQIHAEMTSDELATHLENNEFDYTVFNPDKLFQWQESQPLVPEGPHEHVSALYSLDAGDKVIRVIAGIDACVTTIKRELGAPDALQTVDGHYSMVYFDRALKKGWTFNFRQETIPYVDVVMRVLNEDDFSLDMELISWDSISDILAEPCEDNFSP